MKKIIFLEGLPGVGKTTIINTLKKISDINVVDEVINLEKENNRTKYYLKNDELKINAYKQGLIVIDRGFLSTLSYEQSKKIINVDYDDSTTLKWFEKYKYIYNKNNVYVIYLKRPNENYYLPYEDETDPYGSIENQRLLESVTIYNLKKYSKNKIIIEYNFDKMQEVINEIIS